MTIPSSTDAAHTAIVEALTTVIAPARNPLAISSANLFASEGGEASAASLAASSPRVVVTVRDLSALDEAEPIIGSVALYQGFVDVARYYLAGKDLFAKETIRAKVRGTDDTHRVRQALCWPGALATTAAGVETGICGGSLDATTQRTTGPRAVPGGRLMWTDSYRITIQLAAGAG